MTTENYNLVVEFLVFRQISQILRILRILLDLSYDILLWDFLLRSLTWWLMVCSVIGRELGWGWSWIGVGRPGEKVDGVGWLVFNLLLGDLYETSWSFLPPGMQKYVANLKIAKIKIWWLNLLRMR